jgi:hypothetical protein
MRRGRGHFVIFVALVLFILYVNRPQSKYRTYSWNTVRYKTTATKLPAARGICRGMSDNSKPTLVVARVLADDTSWLEDLEHLYHACIYTADAPLDLDSKHLQVPANRGHESMAYLTFIIDNYEQIPAPGVVFIHGSRWAWHNDSPEYDNAALLMTLNVSAALEPWGYHNLRCDWSLSTCPSKTPPQGSWETAFQSLLVPWDERAVSDAALPHAISTLFGGDGHLSGADAVRAQCCAQFVVSRESIWQHSCEEYVALRQWLLDGTAPRKDKVSGRVLSYIWHIMFVKQAESSPSADGGINLDRLKTLACPRADECCCRLYGRCNLERCTSPGSCYGQYQLPPNLRLPDDWAATHT